ncbi:MAG: o-succinylbenzoate synthase [Acidimicrobiales bacterium]
MRLHAVDLHRVRLPLVRPFRTSFGEQTVREVLVIQAVTDVGEGWGECAADVDPHYSPEFNDGARLALIDHLVPMLFAAGDDLSGAAVADLLEPVKGHRMAKEALEMAVLDAELRAAGVSLAEHLGGVRDAVDVGVSVGITDDSGVLAGWVAEYLDEGYRRIKLKIEPGADIERVAAIRELTGDGFPLQVDANTAYRVTDADHLARLDEFDLLLVEQPLLEDDFVGHAELARRLHTPICLDESIESVAHVETALALGSCGIVNIKPGRVGGLLEARRIHDRCVAADIPVWCGGMLETGIGRASLVALSALPGFTLPGDSSASARYYATDLTEPFVLDDGRLRVPTGPGLGVEVDGEALARFRVAQDHLTPT